MGDDVDRQIVEFVQRFQAKYGYGPTLEEIGDYVGMSKQGAGWRVRPLIEAGVLHRKPGQPRTLTVVQPMTKPKGVTA